jgi:hypothetical protein
MAKWMIIRKHATRQHNLPNIAKTSSWHAIAKVPKLFEQTTHNAQNMGLCLIDCVGVKFINIYMNGLIYFHFMFVCYSEGIDYLLYGSDISPS